ncbi:MAG: hypothetical protein M1820_007364 [Bogoriella megaspora]|nr:MAG: hypothetical protein M1820_007364 [Bogoriella megaspora]
MAHQEASSMQNFMNTDGARDPVWVHQEPYSNRPHFKKLNADLDADVCIVGAGISGIQTAYECVSKGIKVVMIEAREVLSGQTGRTSGHLSNALDDSYITIAKKHGDNGAKIAAESHGWAIKRVGEITKELGIDCEYRLVPDYEISSHTKEDSNHAKEMKELRAEGEKAKDLGIETEYRENYAIRGWDGKPDQRDALVFKDNAAFHPTKYLVGVLKWLKQQPNFACYTHTRMSSIEEKGLISKHIEVSTFDGHTIKCKDAVEATGIPLQKLSIVAEVEYYRTYCIAVRITKNTVEDCLINDQDDPYHYVRFTACDSANDYLIIGGYDHKVGQADEGPQFASLESWVRSRFTHAGNVDYAWSGQIYNSTDLVPYIGRNPLQSHIYIVTGDTGHGLTMGVLAGRLITDEITGVSNPWTSLYKPARLPPLTQLPEMVGHDLQINSQYKRALESDIEDIAQLPANEGGILNPKTKAPVAVYKDGEGKVSQYSAICPHLKGVLCWNKAEKSFDCPVHGSRFSKEGICVVGPAKGNLSPKDDGSKGRQMRAEAVEV